MSTSAVALPVEAFVTRLPPNCEGVAPRFTGIGASSGPLDGRAVAPVQPEGVEERISGDPPCFFPDPSPLEIATDSNPGASESRLGRTRICLFGYCIVGPDRFLMLGAFAFILVPCIIFDVFTLPWTFRRFPKGVSIGFCLLAAVLQLLALGFFFGTACSDPGIVPRVFRLSSPPKRQDIVIYGQVLTYNGDVILCASCVKPYTALGHIYRTPRTVHCSICDNCVERFDHHCPWVGNCVGRRNYRRFYAFIISTSFLVLFTLAVAALKLFSVISAHINEGETVANIFTWRWGEFWDAGVLATLTLVIVWFIIGLCIYHSYLILTNQTTYEQIKNSCDGEFNPWDRGSVNNVRELLCTRPRPRLFNARRLYKQNQILRKNSAHLEEASKNIASFNVNMPDSLEAFSHRAAESPTVESPEIVDIHLDTSGSHQTANKGLKEYLKSDRRTLQATVCGIEMCAIPATNWSPPSSDPCLDERKTSVSGAGTLKGPGSFVELPYFSGSETTTAHIK